MKNSTKTFVLGRVTFFTGFEHDPLTLLRPDPTAA